MATTSPDNIWTPDGTEDYDLIIDLATFAASIQTALGDYQRLDSLPVTPQASVGRTTSVPNGITSTLSPMTWQTQLYSAGGLTWASGQPTRLTVPVAGVYLFSAVLNLGATTNGVAQFRVNGTTLQPRVETRANAAGLAVVPIMDQIVLAANDYVEVMGQSNGTFTNFGGQFHGTLLAKR